MSKENKTAELNDDELSKVSGGGKDPFSLVTVEAGYYRESLNSDKYLYLESNITDFAGSTIRLSLYKLNSNGNFVPCVGVYVEITLEDLSQMYKYNS